MSVGGVQGIVDEYNSGGADIGSCSPPMALSSTPSKARPVEIEEFRLILPSTLGGVVHPVSKLNMCSDGGWCAVEYAIFLSSIIL